MNIEDKTCLIIGGGSVAREKVDSLSRFQLRLIVVAEKTDIEEIDGKLEVRVRSFEDEDLEEADFVICATKDRSLNARISRMCKTKGKPVNVVDDASLCSFIMPSMIKRGALTVAISTAGRSPAYARRLRRSIEREVPEHIDEILDRLGALRKIVPEKIEDQKNRKLYYNDALERLLMSDNAISDEELLELAERYGKCKS